MGRKLGPKTSEKNTILTQLKNVQINVQDFRFSKFWKKSDFFDTHIFVTMDAAVN